MPLRTTLLSSKGGMWTIAPHHILNIGHDLEVVRVDAPCVLAQVVNDKLARNVANEEHVGETMSSASAASIEAKCSIPTLESCTEPLPTAS